MNKRLHFENLPKIPLKSRKLKNLSDKNLVDTTTSRFFDVANERQESDCNKSNTELEPTRNQLWYPTNWEEHLHNIRKMRKNFEAPVDTMGCDQCADGSTDSTIFRFQSLVSLILSSQTKDQLTYEVMQRLKQVNCTPESIVSLSDEELGKLIYPVSFWKRKVQYLKKTSNILIEKFNSDIPNNVKDLCSLPGVGPKMAHICMQVAWKKISGIGVDTHVHRICNRLKWVPVPTKTPEETRNVLETWLPRELWGEINHLFVGFGQVICHSQRPKCSDCINKNICPFAKSIAKVGSYKYEDGTRYFGDWSNRGLKSGAGSLLLPDGTRYDGSFQNGLCSGLGIFIFPDGAKYEGEFMQGWFHGHGVFWRSDGMRYEGEFRGGRIWGLGLITYSDGSHGFPRNEGFFQDCRLVRRRRCPDIVQKAQKISMMARTQNN